MVGRAPSVRAKNSKKFKSAWFCVCSCGNECVVLGTLLTRGLRRSCRCLYRETRGQRRTHGGSADVEFAAWRRILRRCFNPRDIGFRYYGGRGITVCERWRASYANFLEDMGRRPSPEHSIDRIDVNGHYEPSNCRWATRSEQARNTRRNKFMSMNGITLTAIEWSERVAIPYDVIRERARRGWDDESALTTPVIMPTETTPARLEALRAAREARKLKRSRAAGD